MRLKWDYDKNFFQVKSFPKMKVQSYWIMWKINLFDNLKAKRFNLFKFRDVTWTYSEDATGYFICHQKDRKATTQDRKNLVYSCGFPPRRNWLDINLIFINLLSLFIHSYFRPNTIMVVLPVRLPTFLWRGHFTHPLLAGCTYVPNDHANNLF